MIQGFYDRKNDRFLIAPLRCGSSYTNDIATALEWENIENIMPEDEYDRLTGDDKWRIKSNPLLLTLFLLTSEKYKNSEWITFIRDPWNRYLSASSMILQTHYDAPAYVHSDELIQQAEFFKNNPYAGASSMLSDSPYKYIDDKIQRVNFNSFMFDFTLADAHLIPVLAAQLTFWLHNTNLKMINLSGMTDFYQEHYVPGEDVQPDFYTALGTTKRSNSDKPTQKSLDIYKRFLSYLPQFNDITAKKKGMPHTFSNFLQYDIDVWDLMNSEYFDKNNATELLLEMMEEPYFYTRNRQLYQFYLGGSTITEGSRIFTSAIAAVPNIRNSIQTESWINLSLNGTWNQ